ncbi:putative phospholipase B-like lamina ancestor [Orussus abietinus]|uniref:putative phospholipase B-like lamina ancestor n=1 Tax=Orussus abietinus TaxID=222816 RepID=UPI0006252B25|nr:putative phospholipase B-like lamina ancestor [Orussus abietinus]
MLKVVGASWLQTRISTYILVAVALLGIGAIILGEFGQVENDGTYSATVKWNRKTGYRIDFWGQGNDLAMIPLGAARAYYKTGIYETGWSIIEIETSADHDDVVQAYSAGLLEGSLTWQLIHHHWHNTIRAGCLQRASICRKIRHYLRENSAITRERANLLAEEDPYWHMVSLFYAQLDGIEAGWRFAVRRSRRSVDIDSEDFLWLAMASDLPDFAQSYNSSDGLSGSHGMIFLKALPRENLQPLIAIAHNTAAPYAKMLRLLKKYSFGYHVSSLKDAEGVMGQTIVTTSYPGALSSHDEYYLVYGKDRELVVAGTPLETNNRMPWNHLTPKDQVLSPIRIMTANRLASDGQTWSRLLARQNSGTSNRQWVTVEPRTGTVWLVEQMSTLTHATEYSKELFNEAGYLICTGIPTFQEIRSALSLERKAMSSRDAQISRLQENITTAEHVKSLMRGYSYEDKENEENVEVMSSDLMQILALRGDLKDVPRPIGVIDTKLTLADCFGIETFEAISGPTSSHNVDPFDWRKSFPNVSHVGQPDSFSFCGITPLWVWM